MEFFYFVCLFISYLVLTSHAEGHELGDQHMLAPLNPANVQRPMDSVADLLKRKKRNTVDACNSSPCQHNKPCQLNGVSDYICNCSEVKNLTEMFGYAKTLYTGYNGTNCEVDIDECLQTPCMHGSLCKNKNGSFQCGCIPSDNNTYYTGPYCENTIDQCKSAHGKLGGPPLCKNGTCSQSSVSPFFKCACFSGYEGFQCDKDIDECVVDTPCQNNATCENLVPSYTCGCHPGYEGKNCSTDIDECSPNPCDYNSTCLEKSNQTLYTMKYGNLTEFSKPFNYSDAAGYVCQCVPGTRGLNCSENIDECGPKPCRNGANCTDLLNAYQCTCAPGYEGQHCETDINECDKYKPCQNGAACVDKVADYECQCPAQFGGKNCTVALTGCAQVTSCMNGGKCTPILMDEANAIHNYTCSCPLDYFGRHCETNSVMSFNKSSNMVVNSSLLTGDSQLTTLSLGFRTTIPEGLLTLIHFDSVEQYILLELRQYGLQFVAEGVKEMLVPANSFPMNPVNPGWYHLKLDFSVTAGNSATVKVTLLASDGSSWPANSKTSFVHSMNVSTSSATSMLASWLLYQGAMPTVNISGMATSTQPYRGCLRGVVVNDDFIVLPDNTGVLSEQVTHGVGSCTRIERCSTSVKTQCGIPTRAVSCSDLWTDFLCNCARKWVGRTCTTKLQSVTLGYKVEKSYAQIILTPSAIASFKQGVHMSFFLTTRCANCFLYFLGKPTAQAYQSVEILNGYLHARLGLGSKIQKILFKDDPARKIDDGKTRLISFDLVADSFSVSMSLEGSMTNKLTKTIPVNGVNVAQLLSETLDTYYFGGFPKLANPASTRRKRAINPTIPTSAYTPSVSTLKGVVQDPEVNGQKILLQNDTVVPGNYLTSEPTNIRPGEQNDPICENNLCENNGTCNTVFYNTYKCNCTLGWRGVNCSDVDYCALDNTCPTGFTCHNLDSGYDCLRDTTFDGTTNQCHFTAKFSTGLTLIKAFLRLRTRATSGTLLQVLGEANTRVTMTLVSSPLGAIKVDISAPGAGVVVTDSLVSTGSVSNGVWRNVSVTFSPNLEINIDGTVTNSSKALNPIQKVSAVALGSTTDQKDFFKGCITNPRLNDVVLPFHAPINQSVDNQFILDSTKSKITFDCKGDNVCATNNCTSNSTCSDDFNQYSCTCLNNYIGQYCQFKNCVGLGCQDQGNCTENCPGTSTTCTAALYGYKCVCPPSYIGATCHSPNPCSIKGTSPCKNKGVCSTVVDDVRATADFKCNCTSLWTGKDCSQSTVAAANINTPLIIGLCVGFLILLIIIIVIVVVVKCARDRRAGHGIYNPHDQEVNGARVQMQSVMKMPPSERLI